ncbi:MAG: molybdopterin-synthase adenylyltransferase MoeB, partial [Bacteroidota bacterium]
TTAERARYARHLTLPGFGEQAQRRLKAGRVLVVGAGGLGSPVALYLAAAGVGTIGLVDFDRVDETNLQRQVLYGTSDVGRPKLDAARERLLDLNPHVNIVLHEARLDRDNALEIIAGYDVVADGTDNFPTRYLINDACVLTGTPNVYASIHQFEAQVSVFATQGGPCYRCLYPEPPAPGTVPSCAEGGVLGVLPGLAGTIQATEVLKLLAGVGETLVGRLLRIDALTMQTRTLRLSRDPDCPVCGDEPTITELIDYEAFCGVGPADDLDEMTPAQLRARLAGDDPPALVLDVREVSEYDAYNIGGHLIPLGQLGDRLGELVAYKNQEVLVHCKAGSRSARAARLLKDAGFTNVVNLAGGLDALQARI